MDDTLSLERSSGRAICDVFEMSILMFLGMSQVLPVSYSGQWRIVETCKLVSKWACNDMSVQLYAIVTYYPYS